MPATEVTRGIERQKVHPGSVTFIQRFGSAFGDEGERPALTGPRCASLGGFSLHANTQIPAYQRDQLERL